MTHARRCGERPVATQAASNNQTLDHFGVTTDTWRDVIAKDPNFAASETPRYVGRAVAHPADDPGKMTYTGTATSSWELARHYMFTDIDGTTPDWGRHARENDL